MNIIKTCIYCFIHSRDLTGFYDTMAFGESDTASRRSDLCVTYGRPTLGLLMDMSVVGKGSAPNGLVARQPIPHICIQEEKRSIDSK